jgi:hypothetical protein
LAARLSFGLPDVDVAGTRGSLRYGHLLASLRSVAKLPDVMADVDRVACHLHWPMKCGRQARAQSLLTGAVPSCRPEKARVS